MSVQVKNRTYEKALVVAETAQSVTFVAGATPLEREIPLAEIDQLCVQKKHSGIKTAIVVVLIAGGVLFGLAWVGFSVPK